jgi:cytochrome c biogenesis protein CcdA
MDTGLPVPGFALLVAPGTRSISSTLNHMARVELWARRATGIVFIAVGVLLAHVNL